MKHLLLLIFLLLLVQLTYSQDKDKKHFYRLYEQTRQQMHKDAQNGAAYLDSLADFLQKQPGFTAGKAQYNKIRGIYHYRLNETDSAIFYYRQALKAFVQLDSLLEQGKIEINLAMAYNRLGKYEQTIELALNALRKFEQLQDLRGIGIASNVVGMVYYYQEEYEQALAYFRRFLKNARKAKDTVNISSGYGNLASAWSHLDQLDSAWIYQEKSLQMARKTGNKYSIANSLNNLGGYAKDLGEWEQARNYYRAALTTYRQLSDTIGVSRTYGNLGKIANSRGRFATAITPLQKSLQLAEAMQNPNLQQKALKSLSLAFENTGQANAALAAYKRYNALSDTLINAENRRNIEELRTRYETEKKERQITILNQENQLQANEIARQELQLQRNSLLIGGLIILLVLLSLLYYIRHLRLRQKHEARLHQQTLNMKKLQLHTEIQSQEKERRRFASDLHDGIGQLIAALQLAIKEMGTHLPRQSQQNTYDKALYLLEQSHQEIRRIAFNLMPRALAEQNLVPAVKHLADTMHQPGKLHIHLDIDADAEQLQKSSAIALYRIIQEIFSNIVKYSGASAIDFQFYKDEGHFICSIEDNGGGYDPETFKQGEGYGWYNIRSRLDLLQGDMEIDSQPGQEGSHITIRIPQQINMQKAAIHV